MIEKFFVKQRFKKLDLEKFFAKRFSKAGFNNLEIIKTPLSTRLVVSVAKPGIAIGYSGKSIKNIGMILETDFGIKNPHIEVKSVEDPDYNVKYIVQNVVRDLEKGITWKQVAFKTVRALSDLPIMGFELIFKGKMMSKGGRKQKYRFVSGYLKTIGDQTKYVKFALGSASTKSGSIGVRLKLVPPNVMFPDKVGEKEIKAALEKMKNKVVIEKIEDDKVVEKVEKDIKEIKSEIKEEKKSEKKEIKEVKKETKKTTEKTEKKLEKKTDKEEKPKVKKVKVEKEEKKESDA
jgi:small subunit ribosomal protein S3